MNQQAKRTLQRLAAHHNTSQRAVLERLLEDAEVALLERLSAEERRWYRRMEHDRRLASPAPGTAQLRSTGAPHIGASRKREKPTAENNS